MKKYIFIFTLFIFSVFSLIFSSPSILAQDEFQQNEIEINQQMPVEEHKKETLEGRVTKILEEKQITPMGTDQSQLYQKLEILVTKGSLKDEMVRDRPAQSVKLRIFRALRQ